MAVSEDPPVFLSGFFLDDFIPLNWSDGDTDWPSGPEDRVKIPSAGGVKREVHPVAGVLGFAGEHANRQHTLAEEKVRFTSFHQPVLPVRNRTDRLRKNRRILHMPAPGTPHRRCRGAGTTRTVRLTAPVFPGTGQARGSTHQPRVLKTAFP
jgi:hypothetical protein